MKTKGCKHFIILLLILSLGLTGCVSKNHSYAGKSTVFGLEVAYDEVYKLPLIRLGYISAEGAAVTENKTCIITREYNGVGLLTADTIRTGLEIK